MAVATIISFLAIGFSIGVAKTESDNKLDQLKMKVEYDSEIQKIKDDCREERLTQYEKAVSDLSNFVIQQKDSHHEK